jgi:hypothetical protein
VAFRDDPHAFLWNPAALGATVQPLLGATHFQSIIDTSYDQAAFCQPIHNRKLPGGMGLALMHSSTANLNETDLQGRDAGVIENGDWVLHTAYGFQLNSTLGLGVALKGFNSRLDDYKSRGFAVDLGAQSQVSRRVTVGACFSELGVQEAYESQADPLPSLLRLGARGVLVDEPEVMIVAAAQLDRPWTSADPILLNLAAEYWYARKAAFRGGWRFGADTGNFTLGAGLKWAGMGLDYAFVSMGEIGISQRLSLTLELKTVLEMAKVYVPELNEGRDAPPPPPRRPEAP